jgi:orotidine-5'-phosphate decarboxylase
MNNPCIIVALDFPDASQALDLAARLDPSLCRLKVGKELFTTEGPRLVEKLIRRGFEIFLDLKFHDIPNTVAGACRAAAELGVWMMNVHALGGRRMLTAAREAVPTGSSKLIAVTLLTSIEQDDLSEIGLEGSPQDVVKRLALLTRDCGLDGVVCSGIRPANASRDEQKRISTPRQALENGADYLVVGRPITRASDPVSMLRQLNEETSEHRLG